MLTFMYLTQERKAKKSAWQDRYEKRINDKFNVKIIFSWLLFVGKNSRDLFIFIVYLHFQPASVVPAEFISVISMDTREEQPIKG